MSDTPKISELIRLQALKAHNNGNDDLAELLESAANEVENS
jgi:hypothetical protein